MDPIHPPIIPEAYVRFAKDCAALAESHGIQSFELKITPDWSVPMPQNVRIHGDVQINYTARDHRGRPCTNLSVYLTTSAQLPIIREPESCG